MAETRFCIGGEGGPLIVLQCSITERWEGAANYDNSLMNGGTEETDYDIICNDDLLNDGCILNNRGRDMLVLWDSGFGGCLIEPQLLSLPLSSIVIMQGFHEDDLQYVIQQLRKCLEIKQPHSSQAFEVKDESLRFQVGAEWHQPPTKYGWADIPVNPGTMRVDYYIAQDGVTSWEFVVVSS